MYPNNIFNQGHHCMVEGLILIFLFFCLYWCYWAHLFLTYSYHANSCLVAEIPDNKGKISYCEKRSYANVTWPTTLPSQTALAPCPTNSRGTCSSFIIFPQLINHFLTLIRNIIRKSKQICDITEQRRVSLNSPNAYLSLIPRSLHVENLFLFVIRYCQESMRESYRW